MNEFITFLITILKDGGYEGVLATEETPVLHCLYSLWLMSPSNGVTIPPLLKPFPLLYLFIVFVIVV